MGEEPVRAERVEQAVRVAVVCRAVGVGDVARRTTWTRSGGNEEERERWERRKRWSLYWHASSSSCWSFQSQAPSWCRRVEGS